MERESSEGMEVVQVIPREDAEKEGLLPGEYVEVSCKAEELEGCGRVLAGVVLREHLGVSKLYVLHEEDAAPDGNARFSFIRWEE